jgi:NAD(P)-dependent dehydrogenase (short-subunit alcohol dehydrogenase family)
MTALSTPGGSALAAQPEATPLKIGIIGTGRIGGALARHWAKAGHEVFISSRHPEQLKELAAELGPKARVGTPKEAAAFGQVVLVSVPYAAMPQIGADYAAELAGKIIIDTSNPREQRMGRWRSMRCQGIGHRDRRVPEEPARGARLQLIGAASWRQMATASRSAGDSDWRR